MAQKVTAGVYKGVTTSELDELAAETAASMTANHPDYALVRLLRPTDGAALPLCGRPLALAHEPHTPTHPPAPPLCHVQLAARIAVSNLHKNTLKSFSET